MAHACAQARGSDDEAPVGAVVCDAQDDGAISKGAAGGQGQRNVLILGETGVGKECWPTTSTANPDERTSPFSSSTALPWPKLCSTASSSGTSQGFHRSQQVAQGAHPSR